VTRIAVLQMTSGIDPGQNLDSIVRALAEAREGGAAMLFTPEMSLLLDRERARAAANIDPEDDNARLNELCGAVSAQGLWLALGSMAVRRADGRLANRSFVISPSGAVVAHYDKIHMFDVALESGESWKESAAYAPGEQVVAVPDTPVGKLGLAVCYDVRFPALFEELGRRSCDVVSIPAAFTVPTGEAHWHLLQRARAVEASAYVVAAAQVGEHADGRRTYGHSLVVDPWGEVMLDMGGAAPGLGFAEIDTARIAAVRAQLPSLANRRPIATSAAS
jgi:predicted amidohydrolase